MSASLNWDRGPEPMEPYLVPDTFATGMIEVERHDAFVRLTFFADRRVLRSGSAIDYVQGGMERIVVVRIVLPADVFERTTRQFNQATERTPSWKRRRPSQDELENAN